MRRFRRFAIDDDGVDVRAGDNRGEMRRIGVGRQNGEPARDAVELDQRERAS